MWLELAVLSAALQAFVLIPLTVWQAAQNAVRYGVVQIGRAVLQGLVILVLVIPCGLGWKGVAAATVVTHLLAAALVALPAARGWISARRSRVHVLDAVSYGGSLVPHTLGALAIVSADRFFINHFAGAAATGLYFAGYQVGSAVALVADSLGRAWTPWLFARLKQDDAAENRRVVRNVYLAFLGFALLAILVDALAPWVVEVLLTPEFGGSGDVVGWIALGFAFNGMYRIVSGFVFYAERTGTLSWITAFAALTNIILDVILIPQNGAIGAAQAQAAAFLVGFVATFAVAVRSRRMPWLRPLGPRVA
jgi:O-antigen/teichoic acid export membrane protein